MQKKVKHSWHICIKYCSQVQEMFTQYKTTVVWKVIPYRTLEVQRKFAKNTNIILDLCECKVQM